MEVAEKLNELFVSVFTTEDVGQIPVIVLTSGSAAEELSRTEMTVKSHPFPRSGDPLGGEVGYPALVHVEVHTKVPIFFL